jgi:ParB/RepB/Spo0J family partition protein
MAKVKKNNANAIATAVKSNMPDGEHCILTMDVMKTIIVDRDTNRKRGMDDASIAKFAAQLSAEGKIYQNITVEKRDDGSMHVVAGHRRLLAAQVAGIPCPAMVYPPISDQQRQLVKVIENEQGVDPSPIDRANAIKALKDLGVTQTAIADIFDVTPTEISRDISLLKLDKGLQQKIHEGLLSAQQGLALVKEDEEKQAALAKKLEEDTAAAEAAGLSDAAIKRQNTATAKVALADNKPPVKVAQATTPVAQAAPAPATASTPVAPNLFKITGSTPVVVDFPPAQAVATPKPAVATPAPAVATPAPAVAAPAPAVAAQDISEEVAKRATSRKLEQLQRFWDIMFAIEDSCEGKPIKALITNIINYADMESVDKECILLQAQTLGE